MLTQDEKNAGAHDTRCACNTCLAAGDKAWRQSQNATALAALPREFPAIRFANVRFGYEKNDWRATRRNAGTLRGLPHLGRVTVLATDGVQAWYVLPSAYDIFASVDPEVLVQRGPQAKVFLGHVGAFDGKIEPLYSTRNASAKPKAETARPRSMSAKQQLLNSL